MLLSLTSKLDRSPVSHLACWTLVAGKLITPEATVNRRRATKELWGLQNQFANKWEDRSCALQAARAAAKDKRRIPIS